MRSSLPLRCYGTMRLGGCCSEFGLRMPSRPPLKALHPRSYLNPAKLSEMNQLSTEVLQLSLVPGQKDCLKTRPDGTILDGHHRIHVLRQRGVDVDGLPREIVVKEDL